MKIAAIDVGSNSIKLVVVDAATSDSFAVLAREKDVVRLGNETLRQGQLSAAAIERATECIKRFRSIAEARGANRIFAVATASVREARNSAHFIREVQRKAGVSVEILSPIEEARLIGLAAAQGCAAPGGSILNVDIGGGSTEISLMRESGAVALFSVKLGAVGLTENFIRSDPPKGKELKALREEVRSAMERPARELRELKATKWQQATGTSGTTLAIGTALRLRAFRQEDRQTEGARPAGDEIALDKLARFNSRTADMNSAERRAVPGISSQRSEIVIAGGQILEGVMQAMKINALRTCSWALREGVLIDRMREIEDESSPSLPDLLPDYRLRGVHAVGRRFGYEETHAHQVARLAERIFDYLVRSGATDLTRHQRTLLSAAALLHDVGYHIAHDAHHKHSLYLIRNSELTGFSEAERDVIANVARYHKGSDPRERHESFGVLNEADRNMVIQMAAILRIADALDRRHDSRVSDVRCARNGRVVNIELQASANCEREIFAAEQKRELFEQVFNCRLSLGRRAALKRA
jgi:exopolyphosphatase / guanosine-5'-triphosphate,3'-diphosphate pyrophosphatase